jgi:hypothetical protein
VLDQARSQVLARFGHGRTPEPLEVLPFPACRGTAVRTFLKVFR